MIARHLTVGGGVCFAQWSKGTNRQVIRSRFTELGLTNFIPEDRTPMSCLRAALDDTFQPPSKDVRYVVRPTKGDTPGFAVVEEHPDKATAGSDWGTVVATCTMDDDERVELDPFDAEKRAAIRTHMASSAEWYTTTAVSKSFVRLIEHFGGVTLRDAGGVYWLNDDVLDRWAAVADAFEQASPTEEDKPKNKIHVLRVVADEQMVRAVGDALTAEVESTLATIENELAAGELKESACETRLRRTGKLMEKVRRYETAFGEHLSKLTAACNRTGQAIAMASLQASAAAISQPHAASDVLSFAAA